MISWKHVHISLRCQWLELVSQSLEQALVKFFGSDQIQWREDP